MFPSVFFILYDSRKFDSSIVDFEVHNRAVTAVVLDNLVKRFEKMRQRLIFISDENNIETQEKWMAALKPKISLLKFNIKQTGEYPKGDIYLPVWGKENAGDTTLLVRADDIGAKISYDHKDYEQSMFFHNRISRGFCYLREAKAKWLEEYIHSVDNPYCPCYDCIAELKILKKYSRVMKADMKVVVQIFGKFMNSEGTVCFRKHIKTKMNPVPEPRFVQFTRK
jgi:hypothetical protein